MTSRLIGRLAMAAGVFDLAWVAIAVVMVVKPSAPAGS